MITHIVLMKMNGGADEKFVARMQDYATKIRDQISEVQSYEIVPNVADGNKGFNWAILSTFANEEDIASYKVAPLHLEFVSFCDPFTEDFLTLDYVVPGV
ncbi:MAG: Dabb family protein [Rhizobiales bacterium]|nr:Dabb family protein [Hyphomicrobiales bacterium]